MRSGAEIFAKLSTSLLSVSIHQFQRLQCEFNVPQSYHLASFCCPVVRSSAALSPKRHQILRPTEETQPKFTFRSTEGTHVAGLQVDFAL